MAETVHKNVPQTVGQTRVDTQTDGVLVLQDGRAITVPLVGRRQISFKCYTS